MPPGSLYANGPMPRNSVARLPAYLVVAALAAACGRKTATTTPDVATPTAATVDVAARERILADSDLPALLPTPRSDDPMAITIDRLDNGMSVYISTDRQSPRFAAWVVVRAGSRHDPPDSTGLAHYLEHMLFKGSDEFGTIDFEHEAPHVARVRELYAKLRETSEPAARTAIMREIDAQTQAQAAFAVPNEFDRMYASMGIEDVNAFTSDDITAYISMVPSNRLEGWSLVEAERLADPVFRLFYPELEAVYEEKNLSLDDPDDQVWEALNAALMPKHPYGAQTTIGTVEHLKTPAYQDMADFFARWYVPNNMAIVLAGDIDRETALPQLQRAFGRLEPAALASPHAGTLSPPTTRVAREVVAEGEEAVAIAWLTVPAGHPDEAALEVMDRVLDDDTVGLINTELVLTQKLPDADSFRVRNREAGYVGVRGVARAGQSLAEVEQLLDGAIQKLRRGEITDADVTAAKLHQQVERKLAAESSVVRVAQMAESFAQHLQWHDVLAHEAALDAVTREDVVRVAKAYLGEGRVVVTRRHGTPTLPKIDKPQITPVAIDSGRSSAFAKRIAALPSKPLEPVWAVEGTDYVHRSLPAGDLIAARNPRNDLFTLVYAFERGERKAPLLCHALALLDRSGAGADEAEVLQKRIYALGASVSTRCTAEVSEVEISGPDAALEPVLALVDGWLAAPRFGKEVQADLLANTLSERQDAMADDRTLAAALDAFAKYDRRSAFLQEPSNRALAQARPKALASLLRTLFDHRHRTLYFGPRDADAVAKIVARGHAHRDVGEVQARVFRRVDGPQIFFLHKQGAKANVRLVLPQPPLPRERRPAAELLSQYLSGNMGALVFQEIRESRGLAYSAWSNYDFGARPRDASGLFGAVSTQADKVPVALTTFLGLLRSPAVQAPRLSEARDGLDQQYRATRLDPRWITRWVASWDELGEATDPRPWLWEHINAATVADVEALTSATADAPVIISIVGDRTKIDFAELRKIAPVTEVQASQLFSYGAFPPGHERPAGDDAPAQAE